MAGGIEEKLNEKAVSDKTVKAFVAKAVPGKKLAAGGGLHLFITPAGTATWRIKYRMEGKEKIYSIGPYEHITLASARVEWREVKALLLENKDPVTERRVNHAATAASTDNTFQAVATDWFTMKKKEWSAGHFIKSTRAFERDIYPFLGKLPIGSITPAMVAKTIEDIHKRDVLETATRVLQHINGVFRYAQAKGHCRDNPALPVREILPRKKDNGRMRALLEFPALGDIMRRAEIARISPSVRMAHRLCAYTAMRIGNIVDAQWKEFHLDGEQPLWIIPRDKMKIKTRPINHRIPLGEEITEELRKWKAMFGGKGYLFPSPTGAEHIGCESVEKMYRETLELKGKHVPHGWRAAFSTLSRDEGFERDVVELSLDHAHDNEVARAYDRGERFAKRIKLYQWWGKQLAAAERGAVIIPIKTKVA